MPASTAEEIYQLVKQMPVSERLRLVEKIARDLSAAADELRTAELDHADGEDELDEQDRARLHAWLRQSEEELNRGEVVPVEEVLGELYAE
jgi:hypothetical protein